MTLAEIQAAMTAAKTRRDEAVAEKEDLMTVQIPAARALIIESETSQQRRDRVGVLEDKVHVLRQIIFDIDREIKGLAHELGVLVQSNPDGYTIEVA